MFHVEQLEGLKWLNLSKFILNGIYDLLIPITGMEGETKALYFVVSVTATTTTLCIGAVIQAFFNFFRCFI